MMQKIYFTRSVSNLEAFDLIRLMNLSWKAWCNFQSGSSNETKALRWRLKSIFWLMLIHVQNYSCPICVWTFLHVFVFIKAKLRVGSCLPWISSVRVRYAPRIFVKFSFELFFIFFLFLLKQRSDFPQIGCARVR